MVKKIEELSISHITLHIALPCVYSESHCFVISCVFQTVNSGRNGSGSGWKGCFDKLSCISCLQCATQACTERDAAGSAPPASTPPPATTSQASVSVTRATLGTSATKVSPLLHLTHTHTHIQYLETHTPGLRPVQAAEGRKRRRGPARLRCVDESRNAERRRGTPEQKVPNRGWGGTRTQRAGEATANAHSSP